MPPIPSRTVMRKLQQKKHRERERLYLLEGAAAVHDAISLGHLPRVILHDARALERQGDLRALEAAGQHGVPVEDVPDGELDKISGLTTTPPLVAVMELPPDEPPAHPLPRPLVVAVDRIADPGNLGTIIRTAAFYGVPELWLAKGTADPYNPKTVRASMGAHLALAIRRNLDLAGELRMAAGEGARVLAAVMEGAVRVDPVAADGPPAVLILGNEPHGIAPDLVGAASERVAIERRGPIDSLNVAMAGAILIDRLLAR